MVDARDPRAWVKSGAHLPAFMRDFHAQKRLFKYLAEIAARGETERMPNWISAHCYTIDIFLWVMAQFGWTLQRSRAHVDFADLDQALADSDERSIQILHDALNARNDEKEKACPTQPR